MPPFTVLHVCMGNICRSPMAERLLALEVGPADLVMSVSAGTGGWHEGEPMNPPAARQVRARGGSDAGFAARRLRAEHIDGADLVLTATADQLSYVVSLRPDAVERTFVLGQFGRLLPDVPTAALPAAALPALDGLTPDSVHTRGLALVAAVDGVRDGAAPRPGDDLDDPWGRGDGIFGRVADEIVATVRPLAVALLGSRPSP